MPERDDENDTERVVRVDSNDQEAGKNGAGKNGKQQTTAEATPAPVSKEGRTEHSVERSLEEFIARANSTFVAVDGWGLEEEEAEQQQIGAHV